MKSKTAFTKKDLIVVLGCMVFVLMNIGAIGSGGRKRAKEAVCFSNLRQWGVIFQDYTDNNSGYFMRGWVSNQSTPKQQTNDYWINALRPYYKKQGGIMLCPMATKPRLDIDGRRTGARNPFAAWGKVPKGSPWAQKPPFRYREGDYGSYGINMYVYNPPPGTTNSWYTVGTPNFDKVAWRTPNVKNANRVPLFLDSAHFQGAPAPTNLPPAYSGDQSNAYGAETMQHVCQDRHDGYVNGLFLDFSVRKIGLKQLWTLKWHRKFDTEGPWTIAGGVRPEDWPEWMRSFKDY
ncbi:MAG TPA: hypothetical protein ENH34_01450 [Phycisphaerales bacterium]|nr:hypothetical protein [Phycisphaerales bacterium]